MDPLNATEIAALRSLISDMKASGTTFEQVAAAAAAAPSWAGSVDMDVVRLCDAVPRTRRPDRPLGWFTIGVVSATATLSLAANMTPRGSRRFDRRHRAIPAAFAQRADALLLVLGPSADPNHPDALLYSARRCSCCSPRTWSSSCRRDRAHSVAPCSRLPKNLSTQLLVPARSADACTAVRRSEAHRTACAALPVWPCCECPWRALAAELQPFPRLSCHSTSPRPQGGFAMVREPGAVSRTLMLRRVRSDS